MAKLVIHSLMELGAFAGEFVSKNPKGAVVGLSGELGAGKTTFVREVIKIIAHQNSKPVPRVMSPSFVLHAAYPELSPRVDHFDLYRLNSVTEVMLVEVGYYEVLDKARSIGGYVFVEWPEQCLNVGSLQLNLRMNISLSDTMREIELEVISG